MAGLPPGNTLRRNPRFRLIRATRLDLSDPVASLSEERLVALMSVLGPQLEHLDLSGNTLLADRFFRRGLHPNMRTLTSLALNNLPLPTDTGVATVFETWAAEHVNKDLVSLSLSRVPLLGDETLGAVLAHCGGSVTHLNINGWKGATQKTLSTIGDAARELRRLDVGWHREMDDFIMAKIMNGCNKLEEVKCFGCNRLTQNCPRTVSPSSLFAPPRSWLTHFQTPTFQRNVSLFGVESHMVA